MRHPSYIYRTSVAECRHELESTLSSLVEFSRGWPTQVGSEQRIATLRTAILSLLTACMKHLENCKHIVYFVFDDGKGGGPKAARRFTATIKDCWNFVGNQVNKIKHNQSTVRLLNFSSNTSLIVGYFIEGVDSTGTIAPHPAVHPGARSAYSLNRVLRYLVGLIIFISRSLATELRSHGDFKKESFLEGVAPFDDIIERISRLPRDVFPDEDGSHIPSIKLDDRRLLIEYPSKSKWNQAELGQFHLVSQYDPLSPNIALPYFR